MKINEALGRIPKDLGPGESIHVYSDGAPGPGGTVGNRKVVKRDDPVTKTNNRHFSVSMLKTVKTKLNPNGELADQYGTPISKLRQKYDMERAPASEIKKESSDMLSFKEYLNLLESDGPPEDSIYHPKNKAAIDSCVKTVMDRKKLSNESWLGGHCAHVATAVHDEIQKHPDIHSALKAKLHPHSVYNGEEEHVVLGHKKHGFVVDPTGSQYNHSVHHHGGDYKSYKKLSNRELDDARKEGAEHDKENA